MNKHTRHVVRLFVWGSHACFRRPEFGSDLITYDVMPPTVGRQLLKTIVGPDGWVLDRITVCRPIRFGWDCLATVRGEKRAMILTDVAYILEAKSTSTAAEPAHIRGEVAVHLGLSNYAASVRLLSDTDQITCLVEPGRVDLGWMIYDTRLPRPSFFRAIMDDGVIEVGGSARLLMAS